MRTTCTATWIPPIFRHRYVIHLTDAAQMQQVVSDLEATPGIVKVRADETISNGFLTVRNVASLSQHRPHCGAAGDLGIHYLQHHQAHHL